jgi:hypothetical protein
MNAGSGSEKAFYREHREMPGAPSSLLWLEWDGISAIPTVLVRREMERRRSPLV